MLLLLLACQDPPSPLAVAGRLDLREWDPSEPVSLDGEWDFAPGSLIGPTGPFPDRLHVPGTWNDAVGSTGVGTYHLSVALPERHPPLLLRVGPVSTACDLWMDGREVPCPGVVDQDPARVVAESRPAFTAIAADHGGTLDLVVQVANREHRVGGLRRSWTLGEADALGAQDARRDLLHALGALLLVVAGLGHLLLNARRPQERDKRWFGGFAISMGIRALFAGEGRSAALLLAGLPWSTQLRIEYLDTALIVFTGVGMVRAMFPQEDAWFSLRGQPLLEAIQRGTIALAIVSAVMYPGTVGAVYAAQNLVMGISIACVPVVIFAAARAGRPQARWMVLLQGAFLVPAVHDILRAADLIRSPMDLSPLGFTGIVVLHSLALVRQFTSSYARIERLSGELTVAHQALEATHRAVVRFVPFEFISMLQRASIRDVVRGDHVQLEMEILFADIRSFTTLVEAIAPERAFDLINEYFTYMEPAIHEHGGFVTQYLGDGIMALYATGADAAVASAVAMQAALVRLNAEKTMLPGTVLRIGIGINRGAVMLGTIGGQERLSANVIGDPVNTAARMEGMTRMYGATLVIGETVVAALQHPERFAIRELDRVKAKGKVKATSIYEVLDGLSLEERESKLATRARFAEGVAAWRAGSFVAARTSFVACLEASPADAASRLYIERCDAMIADPPTGTWDGTTLLSSK